MWIEKYLESFNRDFCFNEGHLQYLEVNKIIKKQYYEAPKLFADTFEAILGAVYVDRGYDEAVRVLQHLLGPLICMVAKFFDK